MPARQLIRIILCVFLAMLLFSWMPFYTFHAVPSREVFGSLVVVFLVLILMGY